MAEFFRYAVDHERKLVYVPVPKAACTSVKAAFGITQGRLTLKQLLSKSYDTEQVHYADWPKLSSLADVAALPENYFRFTVVRNPWSRLLSCWKNKVRSGFPLIPHEHLFSRQTTFPEFVRLVAEQVPDETANEHVRSQYTFVTYRGRCVVDQILRFETLSSQWAELQHRFGLADLPHLNTTTGCSKYYEADCVTRELVAQRFAEDIERFSYSYEPLNDCPA